MKSQTHRPRKGAALILICLLIGLIFIAVAFSVDIARIQLTQMELQSGADAAARAGAEAMARGVGDPNNSSASDAAIRAEIEMVASLNSAGGSAIQLNLGNDIEFGHAVSGVNDAPSFLPSASGNVDSQTDSVRVSPSINNYPIIFGAFVGTNDVDPAESGAAMVRERDIVLVLDKSTSMMQRDIGVYPTADFNSNLQQLQDDLFLDGDDFYPDDDDGDDDNSLHTEFETSDSGSHYRLSRQQALKLAVLKFRQEIDVSRGHEQLGMVSYALFANVPANAPVAPGPVDIVAGLPTYVRDAIVGDGITKSNSEKPFDQHSSERNASALEGDSNGYDNFDFNYLRMRWAARTNIVDGIEKGVQVLFGPGRHAFATPILIVMTDGHHDEKGTPEEAAIAAVALHPNLRIYTISLGSGSNQASMQVVANIGHGKHYHATNVNDLISAYVELARTSGVTLIE